METTNERTFALPWALAMAGLAAPGGLFLWWAFADSTTLAAVLEDRLALAFIADVLLTTAVVAVFFARHPPGPYRWPWFVGLSLLSTLAFGFVLYWWLNARTSRGSSPERTHPDPGASAPA